MEAVSQLRATHSRFFWSPKISVQELPDQGNSVVCVEPIAAGETVIHVPASMLVNVDTVEQGSPEGEPLDTHELLALELLRRRADEDLWVLSIPSDFSFLPVLWPLDEQQQLPDNYLQTVVKQFESISAFARKRDLDFSDAAWSWLAVNSRCLYWAKGGMTLAPGIDYLNHTDDQSIGLLVEVNSTGMSVKATHAYAVSAELTFCYGPRENGFLLVEYGFTLDPNKWEFVDVSKYLKPMVSKCKEYLEDEGYYDDWTINASGEPSFRIEVALAATQSPTLGPVKALIEGFSDGAQFSITTVATVKGIARQALAEAQSMRAMAKNAQVRTLYEGYVHILERV